MIDLLVLLPRSGVRRLMPESAGSWGTIRFKHSPGNNLALISFIRFGTAGYPVEMQPKHHSMNWASTAGEGLWCRVPADLHLMWCEIARRQAAMISFDELKKWLPRKPKDPGNAGYVVLTYAPEAKAAPYDQLPVPIFVGWFVTRQGAEAVPVEVEPEAIGTAQLQPYWPVDELMGTTVVVVGVGSIGGAAASALANHGVGRLRLVDPDRLLWHNLIRHVLPAKYVGQFKVDGLQAELAERRPETTVEPLRLDVVENADLFRRLLEDTDIVVCCADGVSARRTVGHLARRSGKVAVLACILADGGIGEILRLRPWPDHGCLSCRRQALSDADVIDPEPALEAEYGTGTRHRPMTAVGADLFFIGDLAAKLAVASTLEAAGHFEYRLPGEHLTFGMQARRGWTGPFDLGFTGNARWTPAAPPRPGCLTCARP